MSVSRPPAPVHNLPSEPSPETDLKLEELRMSLLSLPILPEERVVAEVEDSDYRGLPGATNLLQEAIETHKSTPRLKGFSKSNLSERLEDGINHDRSPKIDSILFSIYFCKVLNIIVLSVTITCQISIRLSKHALISSI